MGELKLPTLNLEDEHEEQTREQRASAPDLDLEDVTDFAFAEDEVATRKQEPDAKVLADLRRPTPSEKR